MSESIFEREGELFVPTPLARGPWDPGALHGGAPAALLADALEALVPDFEVARFGVEFLRPVPLAPLTIAAALESTGRQVKRSSATLVAGDREVARAAALHLRRKPLEELVDDALSARPGELLAAQQPPEPAPIVNPPGVHYEAFHNAGMEIRFAHGALAECGPALAWFRLRVPMVAGELVSPLSRVAAACDFGNGVSAVLPWKTHVFVNADLTVHLQRPAQGEWIAIDAVTRPGPQGTALAECVVHDTTGAVGRSAQHLLLERR